MLILFGACLGAEAISAENNESLCEEDQESCIRIGEWSFAVSVGIGIRSNPLFESDNVPLVILPEISYYADNFFIENLDIGYTLIDTESTSVNLIATPSYDSVFFNRWDPLNIFVNLESNFATIGDSGLPTPDSGAVTQINPDELSKRKFSYLGGIEAATEFENSLLQFSLLNDLTNTHSGKEVRFAYAYRFNQKFSSTIGFTWKDKKLTDYYYGVDPNEIADTGDAYNAEASFNPFIRVSFNTQPVAGDSWRISFEYQKLGSQISKSPIAEDDYVVTFYVGKTFRF